MSESNSIKIPEESVRTIPNGAENLIGRRCYRWLVIGYYGKKNGRMAWLCRCDCGVEREVLGEKLRNGRSKSCGCYGSELVSAAIDGKKQRDKARHERSVKARAVLSEQKALRAEFLKSRDGLEVKRFTRKEWKLRQRGVPMGDLAEIWDWEQHWRRRYEVRCYWCVNLFRPSNCVSDHMIPTSRGGIHCVTNLVISCHWCNSHKSSRMPDDYIELYARGGFGI